MFWLTAPEVKFRGGCHLCFLNLFKVDTCLMVAKIRIFNLFTPIRFKKLMKERFLNRIGVIRKESLPGTIAIYQQEKSKASITRLK